jgi:hypothetical protein
MAISQAPCSIGRSFERLYSCLRTLVRLSQSLTQFFIDGFRVKYFFVHRTVRGLIIPLAIVFCALLANAGAAWAGKNSSLEIGFVGVPPPGFQNVLLNVISVRVNSKASAGPGNGGWQTIPAPPGVGGSNSSAELQIDLNNLQDTPQLFNTSGVKAGTYHVAEIRIDPNISGYLVPTCPSAPPTFGNADGCITYPLQLTNTNTITVVDPNGIVSAKKGKLSQLILKVTLQSLVAPPNSGGAYTGTVVISAPTTPILGTITGTVNVTGTPAAPSSGANNKIRKLSVTAEAIGTNTPIATAQVKSGSYTLFLPAANNFGTLYDLAVTGGGTNLAAQRLAPLFPLTNQLSADFNIGVPSSLGNLSGQVTDGCKIKQPIVGATLAILLPPDSNPSAVCATNPEQCVAVLTANTDNAGNFPLPGSISTPPMFDNIPALPKSGSYVMEVTAPGYDPLIVQAQPSMGNGPGGCAPLNSSTFTNCNLTLSTGYITGSIPITPPIPGETTLVQVFAEDTNTNNIESSLPMPISITHSNAANCPSGPFPNCVPFTINVPTMPIPGSTTLLPRMFDLFATTIDLYQGATDPYPGHSIAVKSEVVGPMPPTSPGMCSTVTPPPFADSIECIGHGSVQGSVANANLGTSVVLEKMDPAADPDIPPVEITTTPVVNQAENPSPTNSYSFCAPGGDVYALQRLQLPTPDPNETPIAAPSPSPDGTPVPVTIPPAPLYNESATPSGTPSGPTATPTPSAKCPTNCTNPDGSCPGICKPVIQGL